MRTCPAGGVVSLALANEEEAVVFNESFFLGERVGVTNTSGVAVGVGSEWGSTPGCVFLGERRGVANSSIDNADLLELRP